jgi:hypothetical protein
MTRSDFCALAVGLLIGLRSRRGSRVIYAHLLQRPALGAGATRGTSRDGFGIDLLPEKGVHSKFNVCLLSTINFTWTLCAHSWFTFFRVAFFISQSVELYVSGGNDSIVL